MNKLNGIEIQYVRPHYEHITVTIKKNDNYESFFISSAELVKILSEFDFDVEKKRTRSWLHVEIDQWRVEKFDEPRTY